MSRDARRVALDALVAFRREGSWPDLYLKKASVGLPPQEAALAAALTYGVLEHQLLLDFWIKSVSTTPIKKMTPPIPEILRLALYQLAFMEKIPPSAAVNEAVRQARACAHPRAAGFCNALLRRLAAEKDALPAPSGTPAERLPILYSHPRPLVERLLGLLGEAETEEFLRLNNQPAPLTVRVNTLRTDVPSLAKRLGDNAEPHRLDGALTLHRLDAAARDALDEGLMYVQDEASQLCARTLGAQPGMAVADLCAAPGGKSLLLAQLMEDRGRLISCDLYPHRTALIAENAARCGVTIIEARTQDAAVPMAGLAGTLDAVLCDVPCSGFGVIRKKPDLRYKDMSGSAELPPLQAKILEAGASLLRPGGVLVYSTCTVLPEENEEQIARFTARHPEYTPEPFELPNIGRCAGMQTLWPQRHGTDGFFIAKLRKNQE